VFDNYAAVTPDGRQLAQAYMQYWLIGYGAACPTGWSPSSGGCYTSSRRSAPIPAQTMADLSGITITATADSGGTDTVIVQTPGGNLTALGQDSVLNLAQSWDAAEFNIFGDACNSQANFSSGSTLVVKTGVVDSSLDTPTWVQESFTGETDNLDLVPTPCVYGGASPAMEFMETNAASPAATCFSSGLQAFTTLVSFNGTDGSAPSAGLVQATNGDLYGTASSGAADGFGTVFKMTPSGTLTTLYNFCDCTDGAFPLGALVQATNGDFYGTTLQGGTNGLGTVFKITPTGTLATLYSFCSQPNCTDGAGPYAGLVQDANGDFYGTTPCGGANAGTYCTGAGTVFKITLGGALTTLYSFCSQSNCTDGESPVAALVQAANGDFYGTTACGGVNAGAHCAGAGTVFKITPGGALTTLYSFCSKSGCTDGEYPRGGLIQATNGNLYGTTEQGGANLDFFGDGAGTLFKMTPSGALTTLYSFCSRGGCADGSSPGTLVQANGDFYGTTFSGGTGTYGEASGDGTIFEITPGGALTTLYSFCSQNGCPDGASPYGIIQETDGSFYGTSSGTVFSVYVGLGPFVETQPTSGEAGSAVNILGTNLTGTSSVSLTAPPPYSPSCRPHSSRPPCPPAQPQARSRW